MSLTPEQIEQLEEFSEWFEQWPYSPYEYIEYRELHSELRKIFPKPAYEHRKGRKP